MDLALERQRSGRGRKRSDIGCVHNLDRGSKPTNDTLEFKTQRNISFLKMNAGIRLKDIWLLALYYIILTCVKDTYAHSIPDHEIGSKDEFKTTSRSVLIPENAPKPEVADPCKSAGFMGDIALSIIDYQRETAARKHQLNSQHNIINKSVEYNQLKNKLKLKLADKKLSKSQRKEIKEQLRAQKKAWRKNRKQERRNKKRNKKEHKRHLAKSKPNKQEIDESSQPKDITFTRYYIDDSGHAKPKNGLTKVQYGHTNEKHGHTNKKHGHTNDYYGHTNKHEHSRSRRAATARPERLWDHGVIPYEIESNFTGANKALFKQAMREWENYTCITFVERTPQDYNYILFTERPCGCCSFVGKSGNGPQAISIGKNCDKFGIVVHELGHVIGFWHEHTRPDREQHVDIIYKNIMPGQDYNFNMLSENEVNSLGQTYDYESIMHYARNTFSRGNYVDTILPKLKEGQYTRPEIGQRDKLSTGDITQANLLYKCPTCGRTLQGSAGKFNSPKFGEKAEKIDAKLCQWRISATHGEKIVLNITDLQIPETTDCRENYLEVRDGHWLKSNLLGKFCGHGDLPGTLISSDSRMWLEYRSNQATKGDVGFAASYEAVCGGEILKEEGQLSSPNYPDYYKPNKECVWKITVPDDYAVALKFVSFEIENHDNCVYDYLEVRDGHEKTSPLIGKYCGYKVPEDLKSTSNKLYVKFVSDGSVQKAGFAARFIKEYDECSTDEHGCHHQCVNTLGGFKCQCKIGYELHSDGKRCEDACGGYINALNGSIHSPSFPENYPSNKNCIWQIVVPEKYTITINFTHFDMEGNNHECEYDSLEVRSGVGADSTLHGTYCGTTLPGSITSVGNTLRIEFSSDNSVQRTGFKGVFFTDIDECAQDNGGCQHICKNTVGSYKCSCHNGFTLHDNGHGCKEGGCQHRITDPKGEVSSPNWPDYYPSRKQCMWHFSTKPGHKIKLVFSDFELEPHQECAYDHIELYDGEDEEARSLGSYCGSSVPHAMSSSRNKMYMTFFSDASVQRKGFNAIHSTVCGGTLIANSSAQYLYSHAKYGDQNYDNKEDCDWLIQASGDYRVRLRFLEFEVEDESDCSYDSVIVYDGKDDAAPRIGKFCGSKLTKTFVSSGEFLLIRFKSDDTINWKGFLAAFGLTSPGAESEVETTTEKTDEYDYGDPDEGMIDVRPDVKKRISNRNPRGEKVSVNDGL
ncbi:unnamed protein product [Owenia fusiformis]|uniref:Metalloendopeptidase n=1 Tax=Owenia fusiformis TaxID=6347 RepID=A0A8J1UL06_OWEFU|nr:unnamed protein product [Owenia fusiformis]